MIAAVALCAGAIVGATATEYELGIRTEVRASSDPLPQPGALGVDGAEEVVPRAAVLLKSNELTARAMYYPRIFWIEPQASAAPGVLHRALLQVEDAVTPTRKLSASEDFGFGLNYFSPLGGSAGAPTPASPQPLPNLPSVETAAYVSSSSTASVNADLSRTTHVLASAAYVLSGGSDRVAQAQIPLQQGPRFDLSASYAPTREDTVTSDASFLYATFSSGQRAVVGQGSEAWRTRVNRVLETEAKLGAAIVTTQAAIGAPLTDVMPVAGAAGTLKANVSDQHVAVKAGVSVGPFLDVYAADVFERGEANLSAAWLLERWTVGATFRGSVLLNGWQHRGETLVVAELGAARVLTPEVKLEAGFRAFWQHGVAIIGQPFQAGVFIGFAADQKSTFNGATRQLVVPAFAER